VAGIVASQVIPLATRPRQSFPSGKQPKSNSPAAPGYPQSVIERPTVDGQQVARLLRRVRQIRDFRDEPVPDDLLTEILRVGRWTGSASNRQPWRFIVIRDKATLARVGEIGAPSTNHIGKAPLAIAVVMPGEAEIRDAYDEGRVTERILIAAELLGLGAGIAWAQAKVRPQVNEVLGVQDPQFVRSIVAIGYPTDAALKPKSERGTARKPLSELARDERFS
jgi:nitroreductase